ncbi:hypothetical protein GQ457_01G031500 [Hibiscus cannabinus]
MLMSNIMFDACPMTNDKLLLLLCLSYSSFSLGTNGQLICQVLILQSLLCVPLVFLLLGGKLLRHACMHAYPCLQCNRYPNMYLEDHTLIWNMYQMQISNRDNLS